MKPSEFKLKLEENGFRFTDIMAIKEFSLDGYIYRISLQITNVVPRNGVYFLKFDKTWSTKNTLILSLYDEYTNNESFYDDCVKCFNLIDLVFKESEKFNLSYFELKHDCNCFSFYDFLNGRHSRFVLSFDEDDSMFDVSLGFAFYEELL